MTERLADITIRLNGFRQLGAVVNAMRGIAAARAQHALSQLTAVETYSASIADAIGRALTLVPSDEGAKARKTTGCALVLFCAEEGFAGAFSERILDAVGPDLASAELFMLGTRGAALATERGIKLEWNNEMPSQSVGIPRLADHIAEVLYKRLATGGIDRLDAVFSRWRAGQPIQVERRQLFPLDMTRLPQPKDNNPPLLYLAPSTLLIDLTADYVHAQLCDAALHAFAAENQARMEAMTVARSEIERHLTELQARQRIVRQEEITAEIIELAAGEAAARA